MTGVFLFMMALIVNANEVTQDGGKVCKKNHTCDYRVGVLSHVKLVSPLGSRGSRLKIEFSIWPVI